ncbi:MAG: hypothetical protein KJZ78_24730 [Bryobacteraceae bacterium]|nr:hypothetical protein [Bryobacteraceae bacterium]
MKPRRIAALAVAALLVNGQSPAAAAESPSEIAILQMKVMEGDGAIHAVSSRSMGRLVVMVTDETGKPVEAAAVSFRLPDEGPGGAFRSGLRNEILLTGPDGRAAVGGIQWNDIPGPVRIRITAVKDKVRAGIVVDQYLSDQITARNGLSGSGADAHSSKRGRWLAIALIAGGAAAAGVALGARGNGGGGGPAGTSNTPVQIGAPTIIVGSPR